MNYAKKLNQIRMQNDIPVILLTRLSDPEEIIEGLSCGADSFITKPYNEEYLLSNIEKILSDEKRTDYRKSPFRCRKFFSMGKNEIDSGRTAESH